MVVELRRPPEDDQGEGHSDYGPGEQGLTVGSGCLDDRQDQTDRGQNEQERVVVQGHMSQEEGHRHALIGGLRREPRPAALEPLERPLGYRTSSHPLEGLEVGYARCIRPSCPHRDVPTEPLRRRHQPGPALPVEDRGRIHAVTVRVAVQVSGIRARERSAAAHAVL